MASILSYVPIVNRLVSGGRPRNTIEIPPVEVHSVETSPEKRPRTLKHLLRANHVNYSILYHDLRFHNHMPHILGSAYLLGANAQQLHNIYDEEARTLEPWHPSPAEIVQDDWRDFLGDARYQRAYVDFFEDVLVLRHNYRWKDVVEEYIFSGKQPLAHCLIGGLGHPMIHLAYAYEIDNREVAMEALGMAATQYGFLHKYLDDASYSKPSPIKAASPIELLVRLGKDERLDGSFQERGPDNMEPLFQKHEEVVLEYWNAWALDEDPLTQFRLSQEAATALLVETVPRGTHAYDFFTCHVLTTSHAARILLPFIPPQFRVSLVRQWWLFAITVYAIELRPRIDPDYIQPGDVAGKGWDYVEDKALNGPYATDAHFVKSVRAIKEAARTWGDVHERYLAAAVRGVGNGKNQGSFAFLLYTQTTRHLASRCGAHTVCLVVMAPPAKRRRRNVLHGSSDDEEVPRSQANTLTNYLLSSPDQQQATSPKRASRTIPVSPTPAVRKSSRLLASRPTVPTPASQPSLPGRNEFKSGSTSPEKANASRPFARGKPAGKEKTADLVSMFSKQAQRALTASPTKRDDIASDPISDDDDVGEHRAASISRVGQNARKRSRDASQPAGGPVGMSSQKFLKPPRPVRDPAPADEQRPWSERFGPSSLAELAVHKKKVADVRRWLEDVMAGRMRQRLLILKGAAGTGKTTTVRLLARDMHCELLEWRNPAGSLGANQGHQSAAAQFEEFIGRGGKFGQLDTDLDLTAPGRSKTDDNNMRKIMLVEEFPNTFTRSSTALAAFRNTVLQYLVTNTPPLASFGRQDPVDPITPVVMIISETLLTTSSASADSFTTYRLLGPEITRHPGSCVIEFNAIAPTLLASALELVVQKEARKSGRRRTPGPLVLKRLGERGDIRSAISSLEFLCLKGDADADWGSKVAFTKPKRGSKNEVALTKGEIESLELVSQREASLGIFHAVGKVVYNKREERPMDQRTPEGQAEQLPEYMTSCSRPKRSEVLVGNLIDETGTDAQTFISALHENYAPSCESSEPSDPNSSLDYINGCIDYLSDSDLLNPSWDIFFRGRGSNSSTYSGRDSASHVLRQEEITFQVATRGLLFSLPNPVKRVVTTSRRGGGDAYKMFYPASLKLWREKEEIEGVVDHWASRLLKGDDAGHNLTDGASAFRRPKATGSDGEWISKQSSQRGNTQTSKRAQQQHGQGPGQEAAGAPLLFLGSSARRELLLERLPYMAQMGRGGRGCPAVSAAQLREMEKVVSFSGIGAAAGAAMDEDGVDADAGGEDLAPAGEAWATDRPTEEASPRKRRGLGIIRQKRKSDADALSTTGAGAAASPLSIQKLVLSDDDIEDD
ncbi:hypothetical protein GGS23DRAFT_602372 [Durotheca rogersii]|uniref:uncharacterized protein n=1 Tax=Durotheca rogersii TaxID=419775 RepID=UPI0022209403|nr:uncharacterized protein GGS23DRAFT_602372 [Durotheca rogersii]KAI5868676.1 hypothetical protein GGS23DRAFT_602372 [Durotheca rogersii]